jgi:hypothetical protein
MENCLGQSKYNFKLDFNNQMNLIKTQLEQGNRVYKNAKINNFIFMIHVQAKKYQILKNLLFTISEKIIK